MSDLSTFRTSVNDQLAELTQLRALARRVHAECGPVYCQAGREEWWYCPSKHCHITGLTADKIPHAPDCLWLAAEALLAKAGEAKP